MKALILATVVGIFTLSSQTTFASDRPAHFKGEAIANTQQALVTLADANAKLTTILAGELNPTTMTEVHQLTYTLENALALIPAADDEIKEVLEEVHLGSETMDAERVRNNGEYYLQLAKKLTK
ncbi:hypothetical protein GCM10010919_18370 [Alishewanella longhuensis]|uniref:Cytochrome b562 n=1 Tax=Alishewanella longhuensis TaxID=1091037 RepID=A0ABQ3KXQ7_9ALTE|nr:DUF6746 family protein [Alishewanella longhuensis]GHG68916.1 hypothetical protein GCM10010919_18370 [Alishewanella longhuensis]